MYHYSESYIILCTLGMCCEHRDDYNWSIFQMSPRCVFLCDVIKICFVHLPQCSGYVYECHYVLASSHYIWELPVICFNGFRVYYLYPFWGVIFMALLHYSIIKNYHKQ